MTQIQLLKDDLTKDQIEGILELASDDNWQDWDIYVSDDMVFAETAREDETTLINFLINELGVDESLIEIE